MSSKKDTSRFVFVGWHLYGKFWMCVGVCVHTVKSVIWKFYLLFYTWMLWQSELHQPSSAPHRSLLLLPDWRQRISPNSTTVNLDISLFSLFYILKLSSLSLHLVEFLLVRGLPCTDGMQSHRQYFGSDCAVCKRRGVQNMTVCLQQVNFQDICVSIRLRRGTTKHNLVF